MKQKRYLIYGLSKSGESAFNLILNKKDKIYLYDDNKLKRKEFYEKTQNLENVFLLNKIEKAIVNYVDTIIISPGISIYNPIIEYAKRRKIEVISELELGYRYCKNKIIAITGTNGKTTTVSLLYNIFRLNAKQKAKNFINIFIPCKFRGKFGKKGAKIPYYCILAFINYKVSFQICQTFNAIL